MLIMHSGYFKWLLFIFSFCLFSQILEAQSSDRKQYIEKFRDIAIIEMHRTGIPASIKLAQGILESGDGKSDLATEANNHFGIKCGPGWRGGTYFKEDDDYVDGRLVKSCFRVFTSAEESYIAHSEFLLDPTKDFRYGPLFKLKRDDYRAWARGLRTAGYATNPHYDRILIRIIEENELHRYDQFPMPSVIYDEPAIVQTPTELPEIKDAAIGTESYAQFTPGREMQINRLPAVIARRGDTPLSLSGKFRPNARRIARWNECQSESERFTEGQPVFLKRKRRRYTGDQDFHLVKQGQTMYEISQIYGVRLDQLYTRNRMIMGRQPAPGALIALKRNVTYTPELIPLRPWSPEELGLKPAAGQAPQPVGPQPEQINPPPPVNPQTEDRTTRPPQQTDREPPATTPAPQTNNQVTTGTHRVQTGETLFAIARQYNMTVQELMQLNNLSDTNIRVGQTLKVHTNRP